MDGDMSKPIKIPRNRHTICSHDGEPCFDMTPTHPHVPHIALPENFHRQEHHTYEKSSDHLAPMVGSPVMKRLHSANAHRGVIKYFCREKGHGFILPSDDADHPAPIFFHISSIVDQIVPQQGDHVVYVKMLLPPRNEKYQAMNVKHDRKHIPEDLSKPHETWDGRGASVDESVN